MATNILFFDGVCVMCNGLMDFAITRDRTHRFKFASLQGLTAQQLIPDYCKGELNTVVLLDDDGVHTESDAIIRLLIGLGGPWRLSRALLLVPRAVRNYCYRLVARNRYRWFGQQESCRLPTADERGRMLD